VIKIEPNQEPVVEEISAQDDDGGRRSEVDVSSAQNIVKIEIEDKNESNDAAALSPECEQPKNLNFNDSLSPTQFSISPNGSKYCTNCDISFTYTNTFIAHKKFYCKNKSDDRSNVVSPNVVTATALSAETSI
jgi:hypothetical protein